MCGQRPWVEVAAGGGFLDAAEAGRFDRHLAACPECRVGVGPLLEEVREIELAFAPCRAPSGAKERFLDAFASRASVRAAARLPLRRFALVRPFAAAAAAALLLCPVYLVVTRSGRATAAPPDRGLLQAVASAHAELAGAPAEVETLVAVGLGGEEAAAALHEFHPAASPVHHPFPPGAEIRICFLESGEDPGEETASVLQGGGFLRRLVLQVDRVRDLARRPFVQVFLRSKAASVSLLLPRPSDGVALPVGEGQRAVLTVASSLGGVPGGGDGKDPWGGAWKTRFGIWYRQVPSGDGWSGRLSFAWRESAGPDGKWSTADDLAAEGAEAAGGTGRAFSEGLARDPRAFLVSAAAFGTRGGPDRPSTLLWTPPAAAPAAPAGVPVLEYLDPWGTPYRYLPPRGGRAPAFRSAGPDRRFGTADDLTVE